MVKGRTIVVTGAARGIGLACAKRFAGPGNRIAILDLLESEGAEACKQLADAGSETIFVKCDCGIKKEVDDAFEVITRLFGGIDVLINNAGLNRPKDFVDLSEEDFDLVIRSNLKSVFLCSQAAARDMIEKGTKGAIVSIASTSIILTMGNISAYAASKGGIASLSKAMALSLAPHEIRVNVVAPGTIETELTKERLLGDAEKRHQILSRTPLGRVGQGSDVANVCYFLASDEAGYVTGQTLYVDGGRAGLNYTLPVQDRQE